jgi:heat shock protein HspQ
MSFDLHTLRRRSIEAILKHAVALTEDFETSPLHYQRTYRAEYEADLADWLGKLEHHGIKATTAIEAVNQYEVRQDSWRAEELQHRADLAAKFYSYLVTEETAEVNAYLAKENLFGKLESDYSLQQRAELRRIQNRWTNLKTKQLESEQ